ncbi:MAG: ubiquinol oxidase subunit II [Bacteroidales bacterium]|nr:ubiquinol oxidase subunit II [Bacteroidales bacterium]
MRKKFYDLGKVIGLIVITAFLSGCSKMVVLNPKGPVGSEERFLIYMAFGLMLIVIIPVFVMVFWFAAKYRASNKKANYDPKWTDSAKVEFVIWVVPILIVAALSYLTITRTSSLDPYKPLPSNVKPVRVEVVSLDWNWLFIYPDYNIASVNELVFPEKTPLSFKLTSASVMTSFFIPQLGSQMYAMAGMQTQLNLLASDTGTFMGQNNEFSGHGYANMHFKAISKTPAEFEAWVKMVKQSPDSLSMKTYEHVSQPNVGYPVTTYSSVAPGLFNHIVGQFMEWMGREMKMKHMKMNGKPGSGPMNNKIMEDN